MIVIDTVSVTIKAIGAVAVRQISTASAGVRLIVA